MRSDPSCWFNLLAKFGFRPKRRRAHLKFPRTKLHLHFESLEARRLLAVTNADFNNDHFVDSSDLPLWELGYGITSGASYDQGDANNDGAVNGFDFLAWQRGYDRPSVTVAVTLTNVDFNGDNSVGASDLADWQVGFGTSAGATRDQGDAEGDGDIDGFDFLFWQRNFGASSPDPLSILTIDDTQSHIDEIVVTTAGATGTDVVVVNGRPTAVAVSEVERIELRGGNGSDVIDLSAIVSTSFPNLVDGEIMIDSGAGGDVITGSALSQTIVGGDGNDRLVGGQGNDSLGGGPGDDIYAFAGQADLGTDSIAELAGEGTDTLDFTGLLLGAGIALDLRSTSMPQQIVDLNGKSVGLDLTQLPEIENVIGTYFDDVIHGNELANEIDGLSQHDEIFGEGGSDTLRGGFGNDLLVGGTGNDALYGGGNNDTYRFADAVDLGSDAIFESLGEGEDTLDFSGLDQAIHLDLTHDVLPAVVVPGRIEIPALAGEEVENVIGSEFNDTIIGNELANVIEGRGGSDTLRGDDGDDAVRGEAGDDFVYGDAGDDTISGGEGSDYGEGGSGRDSSDLDNTDDFSDEDTSSPELNGVATIRVRKDLRRKVRIVAEDGDHTYDELDFSLVGVGGNPVPSDASIGNDGVFSWSTSTPNQPDTYQVKVIVTDPDGLTDSQVITIEDYDYNDADPEVSTRYTWADDAPPPTTLGDFGHTHLSGTGSTGIHADTIYVTLDTEGGFGPTSTTLHIQINPILQGWSFDTQTASEDLVYHQIDGPGSTDASGKFEWNIGLSDAGQTHRLVFEVEDDGSPDGGEVRTSQDYLFVKVDLWTPDIYKEAAVAIDRDYVFPVKQAGVDYLESFTENSEANLENFITKSIYTGPGIGVYNPIFRKFINGFGATYFSRFILGSASHGTVTPVVGQDEQWGGYSQAEQWGQFTYVPDDDFRGIDSFTYTVEHYVGDVNEPIDEQFWVASNIGTIELYVGPAYVADIDNSLPDEEEDLAPGEIIFWNLDDDNYNGIEDYLEVLGPVEGEDDLLEVQIDNWFRSDLYLSDFYAYFDVGAFRLWTSPTKDEEIFHREDFLIADLSASVWAEKISQYPDFLKLTLVKNNPLPGPGNQTAVNTDRVLLSPYTIDLDVDSDNDGTIEGSDWEETLEDNQYGLGKLILATGLTGPFTPVQLKLSKGLDATDPNLTVRFDYDDLFGLSGPSGNVAMWTVPSELATNSLDVTAGGQGISPYGPTLIEYSLDELGYDANTGVITLYIEGIVPSYVETLKDLEELAAPYDTIQTTFVYDGQDVASDEVKYVVTDAPSIFWELQTEQKVRTGLASRGVYAREDMHWFSLQILDGDALEDLGVPEEIRALLSSASGITGFNAGLYRDYIAGENQFVLSYAGSDDVADILDDVLQGLGEFSAQYDAALEIGDELRKITDVFTSSNTIVTGHSLGGGLASATYTTSGFRSQTFNAAGLHLDTLKFPNGQERFGGSIGRYHNANQFIQAFHVDEDLLTNAQEKLSFVIPTALGKAEDDLIGPYGVELAVARAAIGAGFVTGQPWLVIAANVAEKATMGLAHRIDVVMWSLLQDEITGENLSGYEFGID